MKYFFPPKNKNYNFLQTNRSDDLGSLLSTFNQDFQSNLGVIRLSPKLVTVATTTSLGIGLASAFGFYYGAWYTVSDKIYFSGSTNNVFSWANNSSLAYTLGDSTTQFDITNPAGTTARYTYDGTGTDPQITVARIAVGVSISINAQNFNAANNVSATITAVGANYFEITNAAVIAELNKTIGTGKIAIAGGTTGYVTGFDPQKSDIETFNDRIWFSEATRLLYYNGTNVVTVENALTDSLHKLTYLKNFDRLYYTNNKTTIKSINNVGTIAASGDYFFDLGNSSGEITTIVTGSKIVWIGTLMVNTTTSDGSRGSILAWDGISAQATDEYKLTTAGCLAIVVDSQNVYAIDTEGRLLKYTGYSFEEFARLPILRTLLTNATTTIGTGRFVHFNGMCLTKNNTLLISINNLNSENDDSSNKNLPSGIWECDLSTGSLAHRYSFTLKAYNSSTITDYGQNKILNIGAIKINTLDAASSSGRSTLLAGVTYYTDATTTTSAIYIDSPANPDTNNEGQKRGYFVTTWFNSNEVEDKFERLWDIHKRFLTASDKIVYKYRLTEEDPIQATITWTSTTTFTTTTNVSAYGPTATEFNTTTGGEVEVLQGTGGGSCTHITSIVNNAGTYTVTLDTAVTGVTGTAKARFQKWIKLYPDVSGLIKSWEQLAIAGNNPQIQIKCCMEFTGDMEFHRFAIASNEDIKINL